MRLGGSRPNSSLSARLLTKLWFVYSKNPAILPSAMHDTLAEIPSPTGASAWHRIKTAFAIFLGCLLSTITFANPPAENIDAPDYRMVFANRSYPGVAAFIGKLKALDPPFDQLFTGLAEANDSGGGYDFKRFKPSELNSVDTIVETPAYAIVAAGAQRSYDGFCAAIFLLQKHSGDNEWEVSDLIRRRGYGKASGIKKIEILPLHPASHIHLHIAWQYGGQRQCTSYDELFMVADTQFTQTFASATGMFQWPDTFQEAVVKAVEGRPRIEITQRVEASFKTAIPTEKKFRVDFHWNPKTQHFESKDAAKIVHPYIEPW